VEQTEQDQTPVKDESQDTEREYRKWLKKQREDEKNAHLDQRPSHDGQFVYNWLRRGSKEWNRAWKELMTQMGDTELGMEDPETGERWQYMGTVRRVARKLWWHEFRHRHHPREQKRIYTQIYAGPTWEPMDEEVHRWSKDMLKLIKANRKRKAARKERQKARVAAAGAKEIPF
jgi:hypothetical protein